MLLAKLRSYFNSLLHRSRREDEIADELQFHMESRAADLERDGLTHAEAMRRARVEFGGVETHRAEIRASLGLRWVDELYGDVRYAWRMLYRSRGFTAVAIGSLALGIGANTIIFSLAKGVLLDQLTVPHPKQLRLIAIQAGGDRSRAHSFWGSWFDVDGRTQGALMTYPIYRLMVQQNREHPVVQDIFAFKDMGEYDRLTATIDGHAYVVTGQMVSGNYYDQLEVRPQIGRTIQPTDDGTPSTGNVVMISDGLWARVFGRSPNVIGKTILLNLVPMTVIGVNPPGFTGASTVQVEPDVFFPLSMQPLLSPMTMDDKTHPSVLDNTELWWVQMMARAKPGISTATAQAAMTTWLDQDARATMKPEKNTVNPSVALLDGSQGIGQANHDFSMQLYVLATLTGLVLLLACANLANLMLARSASRQREMAVRLAMGASRGRILRQVLTESLLLSSLGGAAGLALGYAGRNVIPHMYTAPWQTGPLRADFDLTICAFTIAVSILTGVLFGVIPAWQATRASVNTGLKDASASATRRRKGITGRGLVVIQVALSMLLVVGAGLFAATLRNLHKQQLGFDPQDLLLFSVQAPSARYPAPKDVQLYERIEERLARVPGISGVTVTREPVLSGGGTNLPFIPANQPKRNGNDDVAWVQDVGRSFFDVYRIPLLYGRKFSSADTSTSQPMVIVNQALVNRFWPHENPLGKTVIVDWKKKRTFEVAGIVADAKYARLGDKVPPTAYRLYEQMDQETAMTFVIKTPLPLNDVLPRIRAAVAEIDRDLPLRDVRTQTEQIAATVSQQRTFAMLTGAFGVLALVLACIGIYGLMAYEVARRTNEIGVRMALGARARQIEKLVLGETSWMALAGIGMGLGAALLLTKYVKSMLYGLTPTDPWILIGAAILLLAVALLAGFGPAKRASRVEPMEALRHE